MNHHPQVPVQISASTIEYYTRRAHLERSKMAFTLLDAIFGRRTKR